MTLGDQVTYAHRLARTTSNATQVAAASEATRRYINEGVREFTKKIGGIVKEGYLELTPRFDSRTWWACRFTITGGSNALAAADVAITATNRTDATASTIASDLETAIQTAGASSATVVFNTSGANIWKFTIDSIDGTNIEVAAPSGINYTDATPMLFNLTGTQTATWVSNLPQDLFVETDLPSDFLRLTHVEWDGIPLREAPWELFVSPETEGTPTHYAVKHKKLRVYPPPSSQKRFQIWYLGTETDLAVDGSADSSDSPLPSEVHMAPVYYAASRLLEESHEYDKAVPMFRNFLDLTLEYRLREANANPTLEPTPETVYRPPRVISSV